MWWFDVVVVLVMADMINDVKYNYIDGDIYHKEKFYILNNEFCVDIIVY